MARVNKITGRAVKKKTPLKRISKRGLQAPSFEGWENLDGDKFHRDFLNSYAAGLSGTPPRLAYERGNIAGSQLKITNTGPFTDKPILIVTADHDRDHTYKIDGAIVDWLQEIGAAAEFCYLPDRGISGNGHMMMLEQNSNDIADVIADWIDLKVSV